MERVREASVALRIVGSRMLHCTWPGRNRKCGGPYPIPAETARLARAIRGLAGLNGHTCLDDFL